MEKYVPVESAIAFIVGIIIAIVTIKSYSAEYVMENSWFFIMIVVNTTSSMLCIWHSIDKILIE